MNIRHATLLTVLYGLLFGCGNSGVSNPPARPSAAPPDSIWVGGSDGGVWLKCIKKINNRLNCKTFSQVEGRIFTEADYELWSAGGHGKKKSIEKTVELFPRESFDFFDGTRIFMKDGVVLVPDGKFVTYFSHDSGEIKYFSDGQEKGEPRKFQDLGKVNK